MSMLLVAIGAAAGLLSTVAGMGGGLLLVVVLALWLGPLGALAISSVALVAGSVHRVAMYRRQVAWRAALPILAGAVPGSVVVAMLAVSVPSALLHACVLAVVGMAVTREVFGWTWRVSPRSLVVPGAGMGAVAATGGGAGLLLGPVLLSIGVRGDAYVATMALGGVAVNAGRLAGYALRGAIDPGALALGAQLAVAMVAGNVMGRALRRRISAPWLRRLEVMTLVACAVFAVAGVAAAITAAR